MKLTRLLVIPACAAATVGGAGATATASTHGVARGAASCGSKLSVLVWPHGHPPIPSVNFPEIRNPHVEVYLGYNRKYPEPLYAGYVIGGKPPSIIPTGNVSLRCVNYGTTVKGPAAVPNGVTVATQTGLRCTLPAGGVMDVLERPGQTRVLILHRGNQVLLRATASPTAASVTVPKGACARQPVPS